MIDVAAPGVLTGLIGRGVGATRSPALHQAEADALGLRLVYSRFDFDALDWPDDRLDVLVPALQLAGFAGVNVTYPFKQRILPLLDRLSPQAEAIGAVNTVVFQGGDAIGHNTDVIGFAQGVYDHVDPAQLDCVVQIGAGGAGSATAHALLDLGVEKLTLIDPDGAQTERLAAALGTRFGQRRVAISTDPAASIHGASGIVNASPVGMASLPGTPFDPALLAARQWVYDIIYFPQETALLQAAGTRGCKTINGVTMVINQAAAAFALFTGVSADVERMKQAF